ncbi:beta-lactamase-like protein [Hygrophoropsis aurantiaca]|uniref:Beta-lactamase-like protein n=1 Tax=Hygrophoropsis aurantiaca TaxID=72124 RepID=A0ACB8A766_9AGAM|nr:beta-lactamase-like protein [Hygrophoropsis aurantiaca]
MASEITMITLPPPAVDQAYIDVSALEAGHLRVPLDFIVAGSAPTDFMKCPSLAFSLSHSKNHTRLVFDLGVRRDLEAYPPSVQSFLNKTILVDVKQDVAESLVKGGLPPEQVDAVIVSHLHWDHVGDPTPFTKAKFLVGGACRDILTSGYPVNSESGILANSIPVERAQFLTAFEFCTSIGPFPRAFDYFGDGSMYIIDAPGHLPGHVVVFARTSADGAWILLGGDAAHDFRLITGEKEVAYSVDVCGHVTCAHVDKEIAVDTIRRIGMLLKIPRVQVLIAHDYVWYETNKGGPAFLPGVIPPL